MSLRRAVRLGHRSAASHAWAPTPTTGCSPGGRVLQVKLGSWRVVNRTGRRMCNDDRGSSSSEASRCATGLAVLSSGGRSIVCPQGGTVIGAFDSIEPGRLSSVAKPAFYFQAEALRTNPVLTSVGQRKQPTTVFGGRDQRSSTCGRSAVCRISELAYGSSGHRHGP